MYKKALRLLAPMLCMLLLCGCGGNIPLSQRRIVKCIYVDKQDTKYTLEFCIAEIEPSADTAQVKEKYTVLQTEGETLEDAFTEAQNAERNNLFYEHNEILLFSPRLLQNDLQQTVDYFSREDVRKANLSVFLLGDEAKEKFFEEKLLDAHIREADRIIKEQNYGEKYVCRIFELNTQLEQTGNIFCAQLGFRQGKEDLRIVRIVTAGNTPSEAFEEDEMQMFLILSGRQKTFAPQNDGYTVSGIRLYVAPQENTEELRLDARLCGVVRAEGHSALTADEKKQVRQRAETEMRSLAERVVQKTFLQKNDAFLFARRLKMRDAARTELLVQSSEIYRPNLFMLTPALTVT